MNSIFYFIFMYLFFFKGKLDRSDWQLSALEKKIEENQTPGGLKDPHIHDNKVPKWNRDAFTDKVSRVLNSLHICSLVVNFLFFFFFFSLSV
jgi:hypothetical protein